MKTEDNTCVLHSHRLSSLDLLRGLALLGMITYHAAYDLDLYKNAPIDALDGGWLLLARSTAVLFLLVSGAVIVVAEERLQPLQPSERHLRRLRRFGLTATAAMLVSVVTFAVEPESYVRFGILHLLAVTRLLLPCVLSLRLRMLPLGIAVASTAVLGPWTTDTALLLPIGAVPPGFVSVDYFPLLPWFGICLIGAGLMHLQAVRTACARPLPRALPLRFCETAGRHTLLIYLIHQPMLFLLLGIPM